MSKIIKPFGGAVATIEIKIDARGQAQMSGKKTAVELSGLRVDFPMTPVEICAILARCISGTLESAVPMGKLKVEEKTDGTPENNH